MKICIFDSCQFKFSQVLADHWISQGHEVKKSVYFDPKLVPLYDVIFFDFVENNLMRASDPNDSLWKQVEGGQVKPKTVIARAHDIDIWTGNLCRVQWKWVDKLIFVADHMMKLGLGGISEDQKSRLDIKMIPHGIDTNKFTFKKDFTKTNKIAWVGNINHQKGLELALQVIANYPNYELHVVGTGLRNWQKGYIDHFIKENNLKVFFIDRVESVNEFLEDKDFLLLTSIKEAFSYITGEAMAKGIRPLVHNFMGSKDIWPHYVVWNTIPEIKLMLEEQRDPKLYRDYIIKHYPLQKQLDEYDKLL